jgi:hypothetical protein
MVLVFPKAHRPFTFPQYLQEPDETSLTAPEALTSEARESSVVVRDAGRDLSLSGTSEGLNASFTIASP